MATYFEIKKIIKDKIKFLDDYSQNEEDFLLENLFNKSKAQLITTEFSKKELVLINKIVKKRVKGKPLNKIFKHAYFFKDNFYINNSVLAPRKETEILVETALNLIDNHKNNNLRILDLCCGSGVIGLSVAKYSKKQSKMILVDISNKALKVTKKNMNKLKVSNTKIIKSNLFRGLKGEKKFDIILTNPPYIKTKDLNSLSLGVKNYDPKIALDGGKDGLYFYKKIEEDALKYLTENGIIIMEIGFDQKLEVENIFKLKFETKCIKDYSNNDRVIIAKLK